jgi:hypothetical protein
MNSSILHNLLRTMHLPTSNSNKQTVLEQQKEVIDRAERFDRLQAFPGWEEAIRHMGEYVQDAVREQADCMDNAEKGRNWHLIWTGRRQVLDNLLGWMESTQGERDRIVEEMKEYGGREGGN